MGDVLRVVQCGLGSIGQGVVRALLETPQVKVVGAADVAPDRAGTDLGIVLGLGRRLRIGVEPDLDRLLRKVKADVAIISTTSSIRDLKPLVTSCIKKGLHVVTTCEELAHPVPAHAAAFRELDQLARKKKVRILGTGVNPGFAMDWLPLALTAPCLEVRRISATRVLDLATRRLSLQRRMGAGLNQHQFRRALAEGAVRHVGLLESAQMIATGLGWSLDRIEETLEPTIAPRDLDTEHLRVPAGAVSGIKQYARGYRKGDLALSLDLQMYVGAEAPRDHILVDGTPPIDVTVAGGIAGDTATAAMVVNALPKLLAAPPGLLSTRDLSLLHRLNPLELRARLKAPRR